MIISCPQCGTAYDVPDSASFIGRKVRCKACQSVWRVEAQTASAPAPAPGEQWADPLAMLNEGRNGGAATPVSLRAAAESPAPGPLRPNFGHPAVSAPAPDTAATAAQSPDAAPPVDAVSPSMAASLERRRLARQRTEFDQVEAAIDAVRTAPANGAATSASSIDERDRPYYAPAGQTGRDQFADTSRFDDGAGEDVLADDEEGTPVDGARASRAGLIVGWVALVAVVGGLAAFAYAGADLVVRGLPGTARYYAALGMPVNPRGLEFRDIAYEWKLDPRGKPVIGISGKVTNVSNEPRPVSSVVFAFLDQDGLELFDWATSIRAKALPPGSSLPFASVVPVPADAVRKVEVRFAKPRR